MMQHNLLELGVGGIFAIMVLQLVFNFLKNRKTGEEKEPNKFRDVNKKIDKLFYYHDQCPIKIIEEKTKENEKKIASLQTNHTALSNQIMKIFEQLSAVNTKLDILLEEKKK